MLGIVVLGVFIFILSVCLTALLRRYALKRHVMDVPNARSSHTVPTPRGGGVAIVASFLTALVALYMLRWVSLPLFLALFSGGAGIAVLGFLDDHGHIAARWRLLGHFTASAWAIYWIGPLAGVSVFGIDLDITWLMVAVSLLYIVWLLNLYNFMDGIDGIASIEAITTCLGGVVLYVCTGHTQESHGLLYLALAVLGFLMWNFPPAKIFMGDAGSGFLGFVLAVLSLYAAQVDIRLWWGWVILLGVFIVDATYTLIHRLVRGEKIYEAHRSHAYQYASRFYKGHKPVSIAVGIINIIWLLPIAVFVAQGNLEGIVGVFIAFIPLVFLAYKFKAGKREV